MSIGITEALVSLVPGAEFSVNNEVDITWYSGTDPAQPSDADIAAEVTRLQGIYTNNEYQRTRAAAYPELKEQLDLLYKDMLADKGDKTGTWFAAVKAVKDATAKPE